MTRRLPRKLLAAAALAAGAVLLQRRPHRYLLERSQRVPAPVQDVFRFFEDPHNLARITPPWVGFEVLHVERLPLEAGSTNDYRIRWLRIPLRWRGLIVEYEPGRRFTDTQTSGPYRYWRHEHSFEDLGGGTLVRDRVEYKLPFGFVGRLMHALLVARQLREIFDYRSRVIEQIFGRS